MKELEEKGIGRPSTYAAIISTIVEREYVNKDQGRFTPTLLGESVSGLLVKSFEDIFDVGFTARLEEELDEIEEGKMPWRDVGARNSGTASRWISRKPTARCCPTRPAFPRARSARSAARENCSSASAATDFSWAARAIPIAISCAICRRKWQRMATATARTTTEYCDNCGKEMVHQARPLRHCSSRAPAIRIARPRGGW